MAFFLVSRFSLSLSLEFSRPTVSEWKRKECGAKEGQGYEPYDIRPDKSIRSNTTATARRKEAYTFLVVTLFSLSLPYSFFARIPCRLDTSLENNSQPWFTLIWIEPSFHHIWWQIEYFRVFFFKGIVVFELFKNSPFHSGIFRHGEYARQDRVNFIW